MYNYVHAGNAMSALFAKADYNFRRQQHFHLKANAHKPVPMNILSKPTS